MANEAVKRRVEEAKRAMEAHSRSLEAQQLRDETETATKQGELTMATNKKGGGYGSRQVVEEGNRLGARANEMRPRGVSQIGSSMGNHRTDASGKASRAVEAVKGQPLPAGLSVPLGNAVALNVNGGGPGTGREVMRSGSQGVQGPVNPGASRPGADKPIFPGFK